MLGRGNRLSDEAIPFAAQVVWCWHVCTRTRRTLSSFPDAYGTLSRHPTVW